jgi:hypothetical protein
MSIRDDLREFEQALKTISDFETIENLWAHTDWLIENIEEQLGRFNEFDVTIARLKLISKAMLPVMRRLKTAA